MGLGRVKSSAWMLGGRIVGCVEAWEARSGDEVDSHGVRDRMEQGERWGVVAEEDSVVDVVRCIRSSG